MYVIDISIDSNYDIDIKTAMITFVKMRGDHIGIIDTGILNSLDETFGWRRTIFPEDSYQLAIFGQHFTVIDTYSKKEITVTPTYDLSYRIPYNIAQYGINKPFVGPRRGVLRNIKNLSWNPTAEEMTDLYKERINYIMKDRISTRYMTQNTSQYKTSSLSSIHNVMGLFQMKRIIKDVASYYLIEYPQYIMSGDMEKEINRRLEKFLTPADSPLCQKCEVTVFQTEYDKFLKAVEIKLEVIFTEVIERIMVNIYVQKNK